MKRFSQTLINCIQETKTKEKIKVLAHYFKDEKQENIPIAFHLLIGENFGRFCSAKLLREWCADLCNLPSWLIDESYEALGDNSETISLCFGNKIRIHPVELHTICHEMVQLKKEETDRKKKWIIHYWSTLSSDEIYAFNKMLGGGIRIGASKKNVLKALSSVCGVDADILEHRLLGNWNPTLDCYTQLIDPSKKDERGVRPYPFFLASPVDSPIEDTLSPIDDWIIEPKWDGIRAQLVNRTEGVALWSRGNELISEQFPEIVSAAHTLPFGVYDGEILAWKEDQPLPFSYLQKRLNRKKLTQKMLLDIPCKMKLYDCLEKDSKDYRAHSIEDRQSQLQAFSDPFLLSSPLSISTFSELNHYVAAARDNQIEGVILKRRQSSYQAGRVRGDWWKLKVAPLCLDVVIMYAQRGRGIRSGLFTDYTFGVWKDNELVPIGKAYSGLTNEEIKTANKIIKANLTDKFGPVRGVTPCIVLEVAFDAIHASSRHKAGLALRFPRINRLRLDKPIEEANTLEDALALCK